MELRWKPGMTGQEPFPVGPSTKSLPEDPKKTPYFLESEGMSPYATLEPGEEYSYPIYSSPTRVTNPLAGEPDCWGSRQRTLQRGNS